MTDENNSQNSNPEQTPSSDNSSSEVQKLQELADKYKNDFLYLRAEFENYKRNALKERSEMLKYGPERMAKDLLEVVDNFERALSTNVTPESFATFKQGVEMTAQEMKNLLAKHNIVEVPTEGAAFDPAVHEALSSEMTDTVPPGHISKVFKKAYKIHDKLIRPAQVIVATKPE
ncbi:heat shock protein GrpE [compost metagenome]